MIPKSLLLDVKQTRHGQPPELAPCAHVFCSVNVEALAKAETTEATAVLARMDERSANKRLAAQEAAETTMFPDPRPQRHRPHHRHHHRRRRSSFSSGSLPPAQPSPLKQAQLLRQRKQNTAVAVAQTTVGNDAGGGGGDSDGAKMVPEVVDRKVVTGGKAKGDGLGGGESTYISSRAVARNAALQAASEGVGEGSRADSCSDWTRCGQCSQNITFICSSVVYI